MKLKVERALLFTAISRVQGALSEKNIAQIALKATSSKLTVMAMDRHISIYCDIECSLEVEGTIFVQAKIFSDIVRELPMGSITLSAADGSLEIIAGTHHQFNMTVRLIEDLVWPEKPNLEASGDVVLNTDQLSYMISQVQFCVAMESPHNYGAVGFLHRNSEDGLRLVGTDGFRLSYCDLNVDLPNNFLNTGVCLTKRALGEFFKICNEGFDSIKLSLSEDQSTLVMQASGYLVFVRLSNVQYPNYQSVLPQVHSSKIEVSRSQMQSVTKRVMLAADKTKAIRMNFEDRILKMSSKTVGTSFGSEDVLIDGYSGKKCQIAVNGKFLSDVFNTTTSTELLLGFNGQSEPFVITPKNEPSHCQSKHVLVPIHESQ